MQPYVVGMRPSDPGTIPDDDWIAGYPARL
jgi:hypothetical protein